MRRAVALLAAVLLPQILISAEKDPASGARNYVEGLGRGWMQRAIRTAVEKVQQPRCQRVFDVFSDAAGVPISRKLQNLHTTPEEYVVKWLTFMDGSKDPRCLFRDTAAFTETGSRVIWVCSSRITANHIGQGEIVVIHEMLHSLGLGENPPTTSEITRGVLKHCGR